MYIHTFTYIYIYIFIYQHTNKYKKGKYASGQLSLFERLTQTLFLSLSNPRVAGALQFAGPPTLTLQSAGRERESARKCAEEGGEGG